MEDYHSYLQEDHPELSVSFDQQSSFWSIIAMSDSDEAITEHKIALPVACNDSLKLLKLELLLDGKKYLSIITGSLIAYHSRVIRNIFEYAHFSV
jgi:hypothetical protein